MELLINHISQLRLDRRDAGNYDILSLISVDAGSCVCGVEVVCALRRNGRVLALLPSRNLINTTKL